MIFRQKMGGELGAVTPGPGDVPVQGGYIHTNPDGSQCFLTALGCIPIPTCPPGFHHPYTAPMSCDPDVGVDSCFPGNHVPFDDSFQCFDPYQTDDDQPPQRSRLPDGTSIEWSGSAGSGAPTIHGTVRRSGPVPPVGAPLVVGRADRIDWDFSESSDRTDYRQWLFNRFPADDQGVCQAAYWPLPITDLSEVPCVPEKWLNKPLEVGDAEKPYVDYWRSIVASLRASGETEHASRVEAGELPFFHFTNTGRIFLNDYNATVNGKTGRIYNDYYGLYYGSKTDNKIWVRLMPYFDADFDVMQWLFDPIAVVAAAGDKLVDLVNGLGCDAVGAAFAKAYGMEALHNARCGTSSGGGGGGHSSSGIPTWGYLAAGGIVLAGLGALAFWPRRKVSK